MVFSLYREREGASNVVVTLEIESPIQAYFSMIQIQYRHDTNLHVIIASPPYLCASLYSILLAEVLLNIPSDFWLP